MAFALADLRTLFALAAMAFPAAIEYPPTEREETVDTLHGRAVADPYRWLEADVRQSERVAAWVAQQQALTRRYLDSLPEREAFFDRVSALWNYARRSAPSKAGPHYLTLHNDGLQNQSVLYASGSPTELGRVLLDPNAWSEDGTVALSGYAASDDGRLVAYLRSEAGSDWRTIRVVEIATGHELPDTLRWVKFSGVEWAPDGSGFYYVRYPEPSEGGAYQQAALNPSLVFHRLGDAQEADTLAYRDPEHPDWNFGVEVSEDGRHELLVVTRGTDNQNRLLHRRGGDRAGAWRTLAGGFDAMYSPVAVVRDTLYVVTDQDAPSRRVATLDLAAADEGPIARRIEELVPARSATLEQASLVGGRLFLSYLEDVASVVRVFDPATGEELAEVGLPGVGSASGFGGRQDDSETFYSYTSYNAPGSTFRYDIATGASTELFRPEAPVDLDALVVRRDFYAGRDGARVPIFLVHRKDLPENGENPTLLYGYGGFSISLTPAFSPSRVAWVERGGVLAVANLRGGGEYGEAWHEAGKLSRKQTVFDDFVAAAEWLIAERVTGPGRLAIQGGSNGGLLVGACMTQRPDLFGACLPAVGVMDMLRFHKFTAGQFWRDEYGSADDPEMFPRLLGYSPYHNVRDGVRYPATLITTADTDDRVVPMHSFKFAAALQHAQPADGPPVLLRVETRAGHGAGTPTSKRIEEAADVWAFLWRHIGPGSTAADRAAAASQPSMSGRE